VIRHERREVDRFPIEHFDAVVRYASVDPDEIDVDA